MGAKRRVKPEPAMDVSPADELNPYAQMRPERQVGNIELVGLDDVPWAELEDAYGPATAVPSQLRALTSPDEADRRWALEALDACIHHQGSVYDASTAAVPFLIKLAADRRVHHREHILELLCGIAVHQPAGCLVNGAFRWRSEAYDAVRDGAPIYIELLADDDPAVRCATAFVLAFLEPADERALPALVARLAAEPDVTARASAMLALGYLSRYAKTEEHTGLMTGALGAEPLERTCAALALAQVHGNEIDDAARRVLSEARQTQVNIDGFWPWAEGDLQRFAAVMRGAIATDDEIVADMRAVPDPNADSWDPAIRALHRVFGNDERFDVDRLRLPEDVDDRQREVLRYFAEHSQQMLIQYEFMTNIGLPRFKPELRRFLGMAPSGPLDRRIDIDERNVPVWFAIHGVLTEQMDADVLAATLATFPDTDTLAWVDDALDGPHRLGYPRRYHDFTEEGYRYENDYHSRFIELIADIVLHTGSADTWARERATALLAEDNPSAITELVCALVLLEHAAGEPPDFVDQLVHFDHPPASTYRNALRRALEQLPPRRRNAIMQPLRLASYTIHRDPDGDLRQWQRGNAWAYYDLMDPVAGTRALVDAAAEYDRHVASGGVEPNAAGDGKVESSLRMRKPDDEPFPRDEAVALLIGYGAAVAPLLQAARDGAGPELAALVDAALARVQA